MKFIRFDSFKAKKNTHIQLTQMDPLGHTKILEILQDPVQSMTWFALTYNTDVNIIDQYDIREKIRSLLTKPQNDTSCIEATKRVSRFLTGSDDFHMDFLQCVMQNQLLAVENLKAQLEDLKLQPERGMLFLIAVSEQHKEDVSVVKTWKALKVCCEKNCSHQFLISATMGSKGELEFQMYAAFADEYTLSEFLAIQEAKRPFESRIFKRSAPSKKRLDLESCKYRKKMGFNDVLQLLRDTKLVVEATEWTEEVNSAYKGITGVDMSIKLKEKVNLGLFFSVAEFTNEHVKESLASINASMRIVKEQAEEDLGNLKRLTDKEIDELPTL